MIIDRVTLLNILVRRMTPTVYRRVGRNDFNDFLIFRNYFAKSIFWPESKRIGHCVSLRSRLFFSSLMPPVSYSTQSRQPIPILFSPLKQCGKNAE